MKWLLTIIVVLSCALSAYPQDKSLDLQKYLIYQQEKKDVATAIILWAIFPGAGEMYAGNYGGAMLWFVAEGGCVAWAVTARKPKDAIVPIILGSSFRVFELLPTVLDVNDYNRKVQVKLGISPMMISVKPGVQLSVGVRF